MTVDFNTEILTQLLDQNPEKVPIINKKFKYLNDWQTETKKPTFNQLSQLANYFRIPFGYFFLRTIPIKDYPITHYRTIQRGNFRPSTELLDTMEILGQRQKFAATILEELGNTPLDFADSITIDDEVINAAQKIRDIMNVSEKWASHNTFRTWYDAFKFLVAKVENAGIFVTINGIVGNDTTRKLNLYEFRGFVLYDEFAPFVFINNLDFISGKIFTLIHEVVHVLLGKSASFDFENLLPANNKIEEFCDAVAAEFLVSTQSLNEDFRKTGLDLDKLADIYKVSKIVIARRLLDQGNITYEEFLDNLNTFKGYRGEFTRDNDTTGGNFYNNQPNRIGTSFFNLVYSALQQNKILYRDAFTLSGLKSKSFDICVEKYITKPLR